MKRKFYKTILQIEVIEELNKKPSKFEIERQLGNLIHWAADSHGIPKAILISCEQISEKEVGREDKDGYFDFDE